MRHTENEVCPSYNAGVNRHCTMRVMMVLVCVFLTACDDEPKDKQSELGIYTAGQLGILGYEAEKCTAMALKGIKKTGRPYPNIGDEYSDAWVGGTLFRVPTGNISSFGVEFATGNHPGVKIVLSFSLPQLKLEKRHEKAPAPVDELPRRFKVQISCAPSLKSEIHNSSLSYKTIDEIIYESKDRNKSQYPPPVKFEDMGLIEYSMSPENPHSYGYYFPIDNTITEPNGVILTIGCLRRLAYPYTQSDPVNICKVHYVLSEQMVVMYQFPYQRLAGWREYHRFVLDLVESMKQEL